MDISEFKGGWRVVLAGLLGTTLGMPAIPFYTIGVFAPIFAQQFGWSFAVIFGGLSLLAGAVLIIGPFFAALIDRFGPRMVASISLTCLGLSYMTLAASNGSVRQYYISWLAIAIFGLGATPVVVTRVINNVFQKRRGMALGIVLSGAGLFAFLVKPLAQLLIETAGWRVAILAIGAMPIVIASPVVLWGFAGLQSRTDGAGPTMSKSQEGMVAREAFRSRQFWLLAIVFIPMSLAIAAPLPNIENILRSLNLPPGEVVQLASLVGIAAVAGRLLGGILADRFGLPRSVR